MTRERQGTLLCLGSAVGFGAMAIFAKLAYEAGLAVMTLLTLRFLLGSAAFWAVVALRRHTTTARRRPLGPRLVFAALALGAVGYAAQAGLFFGALARVDASLASLLLYAYPALVVVTAIGLRRERATLRRVGALALASAGAGLVLLGGGTGGLDAIGVALGLGAAIAYAAYILLSEGMVSGRDPFEISALVCTGAALTFVVVTVLSGGPDLGFDASGWLWVAAIAGVSTLAPLTAFLAGLERVGSSTASILSCFEPVVTVALAGLALGERLAPAQLAGGALVLAAVALLQVRAASIGGRWRSPSLRPFRRSWPAPLPVSPTATGGHTSPSGTAFAPSPSSTAAMSACSPATASPLTATSPS